LVGDACTATDGSKIYVYGGFHHDNWCTPVSTLEIYDYQTNTWSTAPTQNGPIARGDSACGLEGQYLIIAGGETSDDPSGTNCSKYDIALADVYAFSLNDSTWIDPINLPETLLRFSGATFSTEFYIMGGQQEVNRTLDVYPISNNVYSLDTDLNPPVTATASQNLIVSFSSLLIVLLYCTLL